MKYLAVIFFIFSALFSTEAQNYTFFIYAGQPTAIGTNDGYGTNALFNHPRGLAVDSSGNVYVADSYNAAIRILPTNAPSLTMNQWVEEPPVVGLLMYSDFVAPENIAVDSETNLYVVDNNLVDRIRFYLGHGKYQGYFAARGYYFAGLADGITDPREYNLPHGVGVDGSTNLYVADRFNDVIRRVTPSGEESIFAGELGLDGSTNGIGTNAQISLPYGLAVDTVNNVFVTDGAGNVIKISPSAEVSTWVSVGLLPIPHAIACDQEGYIYVVAGTTSGSNNVLKINAKTSSTVLGQLPTTGNISGIAVDAWNNIYLSDQDNSVIIKGIPNYPAFFNGAAQTNNGQFYLQFSNGNPFGFYYPQDFPYVNHADMGWEYFLDANDGQGSAYLYDFTSGDWWYTSPGLFPYVYDFSLGAWLYYFPDASNPGHYSSNPRYFYNFGTSKIITR